MGKLSFMTHKFWMGFNGFVLLFLAVNIGTVGVEIGSSIPFLIALGYLVYMFIYLSKSAMWKLVTLFSVAGAGVLFYLIGIIFGYISNNLLALAWTHIVLSLLLAGGTMAHLKMEK